MKKWMALLLALSCALILTGCKNKPIDETKENIYRARDYAISVFNDTMPEDYVIVSVRSTVGEKVDDAVYDITLTYTIGEAKDEYSYGYEICVDGTEFSVLKEIDYSEPSNVPQ